MNGKIIAAVNFRKSLYELTRARAANTDDDVVAVAGASTRRALWSSANSLSSLITDNEKNVY